MPSQLSRLVLGSVKPGYLTEGHARLATSRAELHEMWAALHEREARFFRAVEAAYHQQEQDKETAALVATLVGQ